MGVVRSIEGMGREGEGKEVGEGNERELINDVFSEWPAKEKGEGGKEKVGRGEGGLGGVGCVVRGTAVGREKRADGRRRYGVRYGAKSGRASVGRR